MEAGFHYGRDHEERMDENMRQLAIALLLTCISGCQVQCSTKNRGNRSKPLSFQGGGAESWVIQGRTYQIKQTYYAKTGNTLAYTIEYMPAMLPDLPDDADLIGAVAFPVAEHAYKNQLYNRMQVAKVGQGSLNVSAIRVALIPPAGSQSPGRGVAWSLAEIAKRAEVSSAAGSTAGKERPYRVALFELAALGNPRPERWVGSGVAESLRNQLSQVPGLVPVPGPLLCSIAETKADAVMEFRAGELARASHCECVVLGTCSAKGEALRYELRIFDGTTGKLLAETAVDGSKGDVLGSLPELASFLMPQLLKAARNAGIAPEGNQGPTGPDGDGLAHWGTGDPVAYEEWCRAMASQDLKDQRRWLDAAIERDPKYAESYVYRGSICLLGGGPGSAIADYDRAIRLRPDYALAYANRAASKLALRDGEGALEDSEKAIQLNPWLATAYNVRGLALRFARRSLEEQGKAFSRAIELEPLDGSAYRNRAMVRLGRNMLRRSIQDCNTAIELQPNRDQPYWVRGEASLRLGDLSGAVRDASQAIKFNPRNPIVYRDRGFALYLQGKNSQALTNLRKANEMGMQVDPGFLQRVARQAGGG